MKPALAAFALALGAAPLLAEEAGVYVADGEGARIVTPAGGAASGEVLVLIPDPYGGETVSGRRSLGPTAEPTALDQRIFTAPQVHGVAPLSEDGAYGVALFGLGADEAPDLDGNGTREAVTACLGTETVFFAATEDAAAPRVVWWAAVPLEYDTEPTCTAEMMLAILSAEAAG